MTDVMVDCKIIKVNKNHYKIIKWGKKKRKNLPFIYEIIKEECNSILYLKDIYTRTSMKNYSISHGSFESSN